MNAQPDFSLSVAIFLCVYRKPKITLCVRWHAAPRFFDINLLNAHFLFLSNTQHVIHATRSLSAKTAETKDKV